MFIADIGYLSFIENCIVLNVKQFYTVMVSIAIDRFTSVLWSQSLESSVIFIYWLLSQANYILTRYDFYVKTTMYKCLNFVLSYSIKLWCW